MEPTEGPQTPEPAGGLARWCGDWEARNGFRSTALVYVEDADLLSAFDRVGAFIYEAFLDNTRRQEASATPAGMTGRELLAVARDLRHLVAYLGHVAAERQASELPPPEHRLADLAEAKAEGLTRIAEELERAVATATEAMP